MSRWHREHPELAGTDADPAMANPGHRAAYDQLVREGHIDPPDADEEERTLMKDHESTDLRGAAHLAEGDLGPTPGLGQRRIVDAEIRLSDPELPDALARIAHSLERDEPAIIRFAAEGSAIPILFVPFGAIAPAKPEATWPIDSQVGLDPRSVLVVRKIGAGREASSQWLNGNHAPVWPDWVMDWLVANAVDAVALTVLLNLVQVARFGEEILGAGGLAGFMTHVEEWLERLGRTRFDRLGADLSVAELGEKLREATSR